MKLKKYLKKKFKEWVLGALSEEKANGVLDG